MIFTSIYIVKAWLRGGNETVARTSIESSLQDIRCPSELPSMQDVDEYVEELKSSRFITPGTEEDNIHLAKLAEIDQAASPFLSDIYLLSTARRLFKTSQGFLGLGPVFCKNNDQIWLIKNSHVPLVLRPIDNRAFELVGECYLHGFMRGEMLEDKWKLKDNIGPVTLVWEPLTGHELGRKDYFQLDSFAKRLVGVAPSDFLREKGIFNFLRSLETYFRTVVT